MTNQISVISQFSQVGKGTVKKAHERTHVCLAGVFPKTRWWGRYSSSVIAAFDNQWRICDKIQYEI